MSEPRYGFGVVIRADGTVPFDDDLHPDHKNAIVTHLIAMGHTLEPHPEGVRLVAGPHAPESAAKD